MFNPSRDQAREFLFETWRKYRAAEPLQGLETIALEVILLHPEYHRVLDDPQRHRSLDYPPESGLANPFLHMSLHLALAEQLSIDQPRGVAGHFAKLLERTNDRHAALHEAIECLAEMIWRTQRDAVPADAQAYLRDLEERGRK